MHKSRIKAQIEKVEYAIDHICSIWLTHRVVSGMTRSCLDFKGCREMVFANLKHVPLMAHYALSGSNSITLTLQNGYFFSSEWAEDSTRCGHGDNCTRVPTTVIEGDVTIETKRVLAIARPLYSRKIKVTAAQLAQAARRSGTHVKLLQLDPGDRVTLSSHVRSPTLVPLLS
jgi:hypothetical protein